MSAPFELARNKLLKKIQNGYKPLASTLEKYNITGVEPKPEPQKRVRDPMMMRTYTKACYEKHSYEYCRRNILYKVAHGYRVKPETLSKYGLPENLHALHPLVLSRKNPV